MTSDGQSETRDPRIYFAAGRTLLAWVSTGLAMMGFGYVVAQFGLFLREIAAAHSVDPPRQSGFSLAVGKLLVILGVFVNLAAAVRHWRAVRRLDLDQPLRFSPLSTGVIVALILGLLGLAIARYLLFGLNSTEFPQAIPAANESSGSSIPFANHRRRVWQPLARLEGRLQSER